MADRLRDEDRGRAYRSGYDEEHDFERSESRQFGDDRDFDRSLRAPFREYGRAGARPSRRDLERESGSRMHFEEDRGGYGETPRYEYGRYGGRGPRSDYEFGGGGFQRFGDPYGFESSYSRSPEGAYTGQFGGGSFGRSASYGSRELEADRGSAFGWSEGGRQQSRRGLGPKNYARSDQRIHEDICDQLTEDPILDATDIEVKVANCEVTLTGTVESRDQKRRAEDDAEQITGVRHVQNNLRVAEPTANRQREIGTTSGATGGNVTSTVAGTARQAETKEREKA